MQKEKAHDLSKAISDNPLACAEMPKEDKVPEAAAEFHKRLKKMYCPKGVVEYGGDLLRTPKRAASERNMRACFVTLM